LNDRIPGGSDDAQESASTSGSSASAAVSDAVIDMLKTMQGVNGSSEQEPRKKKQRITTLPGRSISLEDMEADSCAASKVTSKTANTGRRMKKRGQRVKERKEDEDEHEDKESEHEPPAADGKWTNDYPVMSKCMWFSGETVQFTAVFLYRTIKDVTAVA